MSLKSQLESLLFVSLKPLAIKELATLTKSKIPQLERALQELEVEYNRGERGLRLIKNNNKYQLTTSGDNADLIKNFLHQETSGELSIPSLEALTIIAYRSPIAKLELEMIRGVNCSLIIRNLLLRGLIEEKFNNTKKENYYTVSHDFLRFIGLTEVANLPDYEELHASDLVSKALLQKE